jgi:chemotaxis protein CheX
MTRLTDVIHLPARLDSAAARPVADSLRAVVGRPVRIDATAVERAGALGIEVLVAAARQWQADGQPFELVGPSDAFTATCNLLGVLPDRPWVASGKEM